MVHVEFSTCCLRLLAVVALRNSSRWVKSGPDVNSRPAVRGFASPRQTQWTVATPHRLATRRERPTGGGVAEIRARRNGTGDLTQWDRPALVLVETTGSGTDRNSGAEQIVRTITLQMTLETRVIRQRRRDTMTVIDSCASLASMKLPVHLFDTNQNCQRIR